VAASVATHFNYLELKMKSFNTGREYTEAGQIINYEIVDGAILFYDVSRHIPGKITPTESLVDLTELQEWMILLDYYDSGDYDHLPYCQRELVGA